jgi:hypothetical protein
MYRIKKHKNRNQYLHVGHEVWVRDPGVYGVPYIDINNLTQKQDHPILLRNEMVNSKMKYPWISSEKYKIEMAVIVSDGYDFDKHPQIANLPPNVEIFAVNGALAKWQKGIRQPNFYVVNNPYKEAIYYLPGTTFVKCIASARTNYEFLQKYQGMCCRYYPVGGNEYCGLDAKDCGYRIDDYRNPVCATINLLHKFGVKKLALMFCDEVFDDQRPGSEKSDNGKSYYPQHLKANAVIDGNLYWLNKNNNCKVVQNTVGPKLKTATYITLEDLSKFFQGK